MAAALAKAMSNPKAQAAIRGKVAAKAREVREQVTKEFREKMRKAAPVIKNDIVQGYIIPSAAGAIGALGLDMAFKPLPKTVSTGAVGDLVKGATGIAAGLIVSKFAPAKYKGYAHAAGVGIGTVSLYKLGLRVMNRGAAGTLNGLMAANDDNDLAGIEGASADAALASLENVILTLADGRQVPGLRDSRTGDLYSDALNGADEYGNELAAFEEGYQAPRLANGVMDTLNGIEDVRAAGLGVN